MLETDASLDALASSAALKLRDLAGRDLGRLRLSPDVYYLGADCFLMLAKL